MGETELFEIKASEELLGLAKRSAQSVLSGRELRAMSLKKIGDQSFMGIGIPSVTQRMSFTKEYMDHAHGATLGWWNHTKEDGLDKCDPDILVADTRATLQVLYSLATECSHTISGKSLGNFMPRQKRLPKHINATWTFQICWRISRRQRLW